MAISSSFTVNSASNPAAHTCAYASTVNLALTSTTGASTISWSIVACSKSGGSLPTLTIAGTPNGATASFPMPSDPGDGLGRAYLVKCVVSNSVESSTEYGVVGALNAAGLLPIVPGEENYRNATHGYAETLNTALASTATPTPTSLGTPVATLAALRAVVSADRVDNQQRAVGSPPSTWVYSTSSGASFADDAETLIKPTDVLLASNGRWYNQSGSPTPATIAALRAAVSGKHRRCRVLAYSALGDGGGGEFYWDSASTETDNGGTIITPTGVATGRWKRQIAGSDPLNLLHFGCDPTGVVSCTAKMTALVALAYATGKSVYAPAGTYLMPGFTWPITGNFGIKIYGDGSVKTTFISDGLQHCWEVNATTFSFVTIHGIAFDGGQTENGRNLVTVTASSATDRFTTSAAHGKKVGDAIRFSVSGGSLPTASGVPFNAIEHGNTYFVESVPTSTTFTVCLAPGDAAINLTSNGSGTMRVGDIFSAPTRITCTFNAATDVITASGHTYVDGDFVRFYNSGGALPQTNTIAMPKDITWLVKNSNIGAGTFQLVAYEGGSLVNFTDAGSGTTQVGKLVGWNMGMYVHNWIEQPQRLNFYDVSFNHCGGHGAYIFGVFSSLFQIIDVDWNGGHGFYPHSSNSINIHNCYARVVPTKNYAGYRCATAWPHLDNANGMNAGAGAWGIFGADEAHDGFVGYCNVTITNCNLESLGSNTPGLILREASNVFFSGKSRISARVDAANCIGIQWQGAAFVRPDAIPAGFEWALEGGTASWANGTPIHGAGLVSVLRGRISDVAGDYVTKAYNDTGGFLSRQPVVYAANNGNDWWHRLEPGLSIPQLTIDYQYTTPTTPVAVASGACINVPANLPVLQVGAHTLVQSDAFANHSLGSQVATSTSFLSGSGNPFYWVDSVLVRATLTPNSFVFDKSQAQWTFSIAEETGAAATGKITRFQGHPCSGAGATAGLLQLFGGEAVAGTHGAVEIGTGASTVRIKVNATGLAFYGAAPVAKPTITGSRGGNAALADLLTKLALLGLIVDGSS